MHVCGLWKVKNKERNPNEKERKRVIPHGGLESMQYSRSWSCSIGGWVMSAIVDAKACSCSDKVIKEDNYYWEERKKKKKKNSEQSKVQRDI
jgi:hypothetical protein